LPLRPTKVKRVIKTLNALGFKLQRIHGSHLIFKHEDGRITVVPRHGNQELGRGLLRKIAIDVMLSPEDFANEIEEKG
jgi:predicted RNA binding protein YcfA (HicA-like mRNA interferase family)